MSDAGITISFPFRADARGSLAVARGAEQLAREGIQDVIENHPGDRVLVPRYGVGDFVFSTVNAGFKSRVAYQLRREILRRVPLVEDAAVSVEVIDGGNVTIQVDFKLWGGGSHSYTYPLWQLRTPLT
jgi:phage baseplate assembly protein W